MEYVDLRSNLHEWQNQNAINRFEKFKEFLFEVKKKEIPNEIIEIINTELKKINEVIDNGTNAVMQIRNSEKKIATVLREKLNIVPKNYYSETWMSYGMLFGVCLGVVYGSFLDNMSFLGLGIGVGLAIGSGLGHSKDSDAKKQGLQLDVKNNYL